MSPRTLARLVTTALSAAALLGPAARARAQVVGPIDQFLAVEPYFAYTLFDDEGVGTSGGGRYKALRGVGVRVRFGQEAGAGGGARPRSGVSLFAQTTAPTDGYRVTHYGAQVDVAALPKPLGGVLDPLLSLGAAAYAYRRPVLGPAVVVATPAGGTSSAYPRFGLRETRAALSPGVGLRAALARRVNVRVDARDAIVFNQRTVTTALRTANNFEFLGGVGFAF